MYLTVLALVRPALLFYFHHQCYLPLKHQYRRRQRILIPEVIGYYTLTGPPHI